MEDVADSMFRMDVQELFDVTFCYFPITFTPPKDDPYGITSEDLILSLRCAHCLLSAID